MFSTKSNEEVYTAPVCMVFSVKVQGVLCSSPGGAGDDDETLDEGDLN